MFFRFHTFFLLCFITSSVWAYGDGPGPVSADSSSSGSSQVDATGNVEAREASDIRQSEGLQSPQAQVNHNEGENKAAKKPNGWLDVLTHYDNRFFSWVRRRREVEE